MRYRIKREASFFFFFFFISFLFRLSSSYVAVYSKCTHHLTSPYCVGKKKFMPIVHWIDCVYSRADCTHTPIHASVEDCTYISMECRFDWCAAANRTRKSVYVCACVSVCVSMRQRPKFGFQKIAWSSE